jgi:hypothetical protein
VKRSMVQTRDRETYLQLAAPQVPRFDPEHKTDGIHQVGLACRSMSPHHQVLSEKPQNRLRAKRKTRGGMASSRGWQGASRCPTVAGLHVQRGYHAAPPCTSRDSPSLTLPPTKLVQAAAESTDLNHWVLSLL